MIQPRLIYRKKRFLLPLSIMLPVGALLLWYVVDTSVSPPVINDMTSLDWQVSEPDSGLRVCDGNWLKQNRYGLWELYLEGSPFERGVANGKLTKELIAFQEEAFVNRLREMIPSESYLNFLKYFIYWFNRDLDEYLMPAFKEEIYGISFSADPRFNFIGSPYQRMLNYHSAHDIGHALQELMLVGCTSFGVWGGMSADSSLLIGRNFDFYMGDDFARNPIVCFEKPDNGYPFAMITWGGMIGTVSGMNLRGLTVTINAARSEIPFSARTPISLLAREILQYAETIDDAYAIARNRETFVSESLLIGSGQENRAAIIEKAPFGIALRDPRQEYIICANHFQDSLFRNDPLNIENLRNSSSWYRSRKVLREISSLSPMDPKDAVQLLRNREGVNGQDIGLGNEKAINQLIAHHAVVFQPASLRMWVSTPPWQLGAFVCYDLTKIFHTFASLQKQAEVTEPGLIIPADPFLTSPDFQRFLLYKRLRTEILSHLNDDPDNLPDAVSLQEFRSTNLMFYEVWSLSGDVFLANAEWKEAAAMYRKALTLEIPRWEEKEQIIRKLVDCEYDTNNTTK